MEAIFWVVLFSFTQGDTVWSFGCREGCGSAGGVVWVRVVAQGLGGCALRAGVDVGVVSLYGFCCIGVCPVWD